MEINTEITKGDYADFNKHWYRKNRLKKVIILIVLSSLIIPLISNDSFNLPFYIVSVIIFLIISSLIFLIGMKFLTLYIRNLPSKKGEILGKKTITISEDGITRKSEYNNSFQKWEGIKSLETSKKSIFIMVDNLAGFIIPKRSFKNESQMKEFIDTIKNKIT